MSAIYDIATKKKTTSLDKVVLLSSDKLIESAAIELTALREVAEAARAEGIARPDHPNYPRIYKRLQDALAKLDGLK